MFQSPTVAVVTMQIPMSDVALMQRVVADAMSPFAMFHGMSVVSAGASLLVRLEFFNRAQVNHMCRVFPDLYTWHSYAEESRCMDEF